MAPKSRPHQGPLGANGFGHLSATADGAIHEPKQTSPRSAHRLEPACFGQFLAGHPSPATQLQNPDHRSEAKQITEIGTAPTAQIPGEALARLAQRESSSEKQHRAS